MSKETLKKLFKIVNDSADTIEEAIKELEAVNSTESRELQHEVEEVKECVCNLSDMIFDMI